MQLEQREQELAAIGAAIGCNRRPCIEHHISAGRGAGLCDAELVEAVNAARAMRDEAIRLLAPRIDELLERQIAAALALGRGAGEVAAALKMAGYVHKRPGEMTADKARHALDGLAGVAGRRLIAEHARLKDLT